MALGVLSVDLVAKLAKFEADMGRAARATEASAQRMAKAFDLAKGGLAALGVSLSGAFLLAFGRDIINSVDALNDLKDATGSSIENLSALEDVAGRTGASMDTVGTALVKFNGVLKDIKPDSNAARALTALGLSAKDLKALDPSEALRRTAVALSGFADDGNKARLVQELFGKSLREVAPFLNDLAKQGSLNAKVTTEQAEQAERFNLQLFKMQTEASQAGRSIAMDLLPAMNRLLESFNKIKDQGLVFEVLKDAAKGVVGANRLTSDPGADVNRLLSERIELEKKLAAQQALRQQTGYKGEDKVGDGLQRQIFQINELLAVSRIRQQTRVASAYDGKDMGDAVSRRLAQASKSLPKLPDSVQGDDAAKKAMEALEKAYQSFIGNVRQRNAEQKQELELGRSLTDSEKLRIQFASELDDKLKGLGDKKRESIEAEIAEAAAIEKKAAARKYDLEIYQQQQAIQEDIRQDEVKQDKAREQLRESVNDYVRAVIDETELIELQQRLAGKSQEDRDIAIAQYRIQLDLKKKLREIDSPETGLDEAGRETERAKARAAAAQASLNVEKRVNIDRSIALGDSIEQGIMNGFRDGKGAADIFLNELKAQFAKTILRPLIQPVAEAGSALISSGLKSLFGGFFADGGVPPMGKVSVVGEKGPELFVPHAAGRIVSNSALGGGGVNNYTINIDSRADRAQIMADVQSVIARNNRGIQASMMRSQGYGGAAA